MAGIISATVSGYVAKDPELKSVGGSEVANFSIPVSEKVKGEEKTTWVRCAVWGKRASVIGQYVKKGSFLTVMGRLSERSYVDKDGKERSSLELNVSDFAFGPKAGGNGADEVTSSPAGDVEPF